MKPNLGTTTPVSGASASLAGAQRLRHPLGLPAGSVRALLTFMVLGLIWALWLMPERKAVSVPLYLYYLMFLILGYYFAARGHAVDDAERRERHPLFLPRGSIRFLIVVGFAAAIGWGSYSNPNFLERLKVPAVADQPYLPLILLGAFFAGAVVARLSRRLLAGPSGLPPWFQDLQAWLSLIAVLGLGAETIIRLVINPTLEPGRELHLLHWESVLAGVVAFYFGART